MFNSSKLTLGHARLSSVALQEELTIPANAFEVDEAAERITIQLPVPLSAGAQLVLQVDFSGEVSSSTMGYYRCSWEDECKTKYYALTQFQVRTPRPSPVIRYDADVLYYFFTSPPRHALLSLAGTSHSSRLLSP